MFIATLKEPKKDTAHLQQDSKVIGRIFGNHHAKPSEMRLLQTLREQEEKGHVQPKLWRRSLEQYGAGLEFRGRGVPGIMGFTQYLEFMCKNSADPLRILDVGVGSGAQWVDFLKKFNVEFHATAFNPALIDEPAIRNKTVKLAPHELSSLFNRGMFDLVVSYHGTELVEKEALENIMFILKNAGEAIVMGGNGRMPGYWMNEPELGTYTKFFRVLGTFKARDFSGEWTYHLRKNSG
ncbi:MAG: hypothetical protein WC488_02275 [Candidatus Micrarchaeia archaeon]